MNTFSGGAPILSAAISFLKNYVIRERRRVETFKKGEAEGKGEAEQSRWTQFSLFLTSVRRIVQVLVHCTSNYSSLSSLRSDVVLLR